MSEWPLVSVVIPMRNEAASIGDLLDCVLAQDYPADRLEVLVVDGASTDDSAQAVERYGQRDPRVRLLANPRRIVPTASMRPPTLSAPVRRRVSTPMRT